MEKLKGYDKAQVYTDVERLPIGGYVLKILNVELKEYDWGRILLLSFDIAEGDYKGFYQRNYNNNSNEDKKWKGTYRMRIPVEDGSEKDNWTMRRFKTDISDFEESNPGYHWDWDENTLKDKLIGGLFNNKEYEIDGRTGFYTNCCRLTSVEKIRSGDFKIPADTLLKNKSGSGSAADSDGFMNVPESKSGDVPFN